MPDTPYAAPAWVCLQICLHKSYANVPTLRKDMPTFLRGSAGKSPI